jgi:aspartyl-tRNA(Asn)/glutamyl-tRNA(Gln) amidotransferase subunit B
VRSEIPELPEPRRQRLVADYGLSDEDALQVTQSRAFADYFETAARSCGHPKSVFNWMVGDLTRCLKRDDREVGDCPVTPEQLARLISLVESGSISGKIAKDVFDKMIRTGSGPDDVIAAEGVQQISDRGSIESLIDRVMRENPAEVAAYRGGKEGLMGFFVGQIMKKTRGQANPQLVNEMLKAKLRGQGG